MPARSLEGKVALTLRLDVGDAVRALFYVLTSPPNVLHGEIVLRPRVVWRRRGEASV